MWVSRRNRPFAIVADSEFLEIVHMLYAKAEVPHPTTVSRDVQEIFGISRSHLADHLQVRTAVVTYPY